MANYRYTHLGTTLTFTLSKVDEEITFSTECPVCNKTYNSAYGFCPYDGTLLTKNNQTVKTSCDLYDKIRELVEEQFEESLLFNVINYKNSEDIYLISNRKVGSEYYKETGRADANDDSFLETKETEKSKTNLIAFKKVFQREMAALHALGIDFKIKYGLLTISEC